MSLNALLKVLTGDPLGQNQIFWLWLSNEKFKLVGLNRMTQKAQNNIFCMVLFQYSSKF